MQINPYTLGATGNPWDCVVSAAATLDASSFDSLWIYDHFLYEGGYAGHPYPEPVLECFTTLGAIAAVTHRIRLGELVVGVPYRNPAMLAKMATTLDLISHGRSILGLGASWHQREYEAYGWGVYEAPAVRLKRLDEAIRLMQTLWSQQPASFEGAFYALQAVTDFPAPVQRPHPPLLVAGSGEKVTLRIAARYAQMCNVTGSPENVQRLFGVLREHCERLQRPYAEVTRSIYATIVLAQSEASLAAKREQWGAFLPPGTLLGTPAQIIDRLGAYAQAGCQYLIFRTPDWFELEPLELFSREVIPALAAA
ncbi:MAG TPA: TIGR03560 family F420-dependent LLM class oxidoreductase [Chloroflexota bacterium]|nr:TIGR03560 family F420-dependent LLM class oxidoreductase [Chloroflexota bacterium]